MKLSRCQLSPRHSLRTPWSPPSQLPLEWTRAMTWLNLSSPGVKTMTPELKMSGHPTSGTAANSWGSVKRWDKGRSGNTSASRKITLSNWVRRSMCSFVSTVWRSGRPENAKKKRAVRLALRDAKGYSASRARERVVCGHRPDRQCVTGGGQIRPGRHVTSLNVGTHRGARVRRSGRLQ